MIKYCKNFLKEAKTLSKKFKLIKHDLKEAIQEIENNDLGTALGSKLFKKRVKNSSIPTGKSDGFRIILYQIIEQDVVLISIYSKNDRESLSDEDLKVLVKEYLA